MRVAQLVCCCGNDSNDSDMHAEESPTVCENALKLSNSFFGSTLIISLAHCAPRDLLDCIFLQFVYADVFVSFNYAKEKLFSRTSELELDSPRAVTPDVSFPSSR